MKKTGKRSVSIVLSTPDDKNSWISLRSGMHCGFKDISYEIRQQFLNQLMDEARAWTEQIDTLPILRQADKGEPCEGWLCDEDVVALGYDSGSKIRYASPAFLPWRSITAEQEYGFREFCIQMIYWMMDTSCPEASVISIDVQACSMSQAKSKPDYSIRVTTRAPGDSDYALSKSLTDLAENIFESSVAPFHPRDVTLQEDFLHADRKGTLVNGYIGRVFCKKSELLKKSAHERIELQATFSEFQPSLHAHA